jgi:hypothetical protein
VLLSEEQIDADVGAGLPSPIGEELAVLEKGLVAPGRKGLVLACGTPLMRMRRWLG